MCKFLLHTAMNNVIKTQLLLLVVGVGTIADYIMISIGLAVIFKTGGVGGAISCYVGGLMCVALTATADTLWQQRRNPTYLLLIPLLTAAFVISADASINYVGIYVLGGQDYSVDVSKGINWVQGWESANIFAGVGFGVVIFYTLICPVFITFLIREQQIHLRRKETLRDSRR
jgi:hypothetical protein